MYQLNWCYSLTDSFNLSVVNVFTSLLFKMKMVFYFYIWEMDLAFLYYKCDRELGIFSLSGLWIFRFFATKHFQPYLLKIDCWLWTWKNRKSLSTFGKVMSTFLLVIVPPCIMNIWCHYDTCRWQVSHLLYILSPSSELLTVTSCSSMLCNLLAFTTVCVRFVREFVCVNVSTTILNVFVH